MTLPFARRAALASCALLALSGCDALDSFTASTQPLETYELSPTPAGAARAAGGPNLFVDAPSASGAVATDRIAVRSEARKVLYLPGARWADPAPEHVQLLIVRSLVNSGRFGFVTGETGGPIPDYLLVSDLQDFHAALAPENAEGAPASVTVRLTVALVRDADRSSVASRSFEATAPAASDGTDDLVAAYDAALRAVLTELTRWAIAALPRA